MLTGTSLCHPPAAVRGRYNDESHLQDKAVGAKETRPDARQSDSRAGTIPSNVHRNCHLLVYYFSASLEALVSHLKGLLQCVAHSRGIIEDTCMQTDVRMDSWMMKMAVVFVDN